MILGCDFDEAQTMRRRRHEPPIASVKVLTCSRARETGLLTVIQPE